MTKSQILDRVTMMLGGRVAEALILKEISTVPKTIWNGLQSWCESLLRSGIYGEAAP